MQDDRLEIAVSFDERRGYIATAPELRTSTAPPGSSATSAAAVVLWAASGCGRGRSNPALIRG
jgi:hypothetical protein